MFRSRDGCSSRFMVMPISGRMITPPRVSSTFGIFYSTFPAVCQRDILALEVLHSAIPHQLNRGGVRIELNSMQAAGRMAALVLPNRDAEKERILDISEIRASSFLGGSSLSRVGMQAWRRDGPLQGDPICAN